MQGVTAMAPGESGPFPVAMVPGPPAGLEPLEALDADGRLTGRQRLDAVRAHPLALAGDHHGAVTHRRAAASRTTSLSEQRCLIARAARLAEGRST